MRSSLTLLLPALLLAGCTCGGVADGTDLPPDSPGDTAGDSDTDTDADSDTDSDADADADTDADTDIELSTSAADVVSTGSPFRVFDANGDGVKDLVHDRSVGDHTVYYADDWQGAQVLNDFEVSGEHGITRDLNGDGVEDIYVVVPTADREMVSIMAGPLATLGEGEPWLRFHTEYAFHHDVLRLPDIDGDGHAELAWAGCGSEQGLWIIPTDLEDASALEDVSLAHIRGGSNGSFGARLETADLDGDGLVELGVHDEGYPAHSYHWVGRVYVLDPSISGDPYAHDAADVVFHGTHGLQIVDFAFPGDQTGDGHQDVIVADEHTAYLVEGPLPAFMDHEDLRAEAHTQMIGGDLQAVETAGDVNGDGRDDLALWGSENQPWILLEIPEGTLTADDADLTFAHDSTLAFSAGFDADGDGFSELVVQDDQAFYLFVGR